MITVIFEVHIASGCKDDYLRIAGDLLETLNSIDGFISVERFQSLSDPTKLLSLSFFEDEKALDCWRNTHNHRVAQSRGRKEIFDDYRLRVAHVIRDYGMFDRAQVPKDSKEVNH